MVGFLSGKYKLTGGGYEYDGQVLSEINEAEIRETLASWKGEVESVAVVGVFSSLKNDQELAVQKLLKKNLARIFRFRFPLP